MRESNFGSSLGYKFVELACRPPPPRELPAGSRGPRARKPQCRPAVRTRRAVTCPAGAVMRAR